MDALQFQSRIHITYDRYFSFVSIVPMLKGNEWDNVELEREWVSEGDGIFSQIDTYLVPIYRYIQFNSIIMCVGSIY